MTNKDTKAAIVVAPNRPNNRYPYHRYPHNKTSNPSTSTLPIYISWFTWIESENILHIHMTSAERYTQIYKYYSSSYSHITHMYIHTLALP